MPPADAVAPLNHRNWTPIEIWSTLAGMPVVRFKCGKCGVEATRIGSDQHYVPSVDPDTFERLCVMAAAARASGEPADPMSVNCPFLRTARPEQEHAGQRLK